MNAAIRTGFTLVELLVTISILAVLAALLLSAVNVVRDSARGIKCLSNLRQLGMVTAMFEQDNDGRYPGGAQTASGSVSWHTILATEVLTGQGVSVGLFGGIRGMSCPSFTQSSGSWLRPYSMNRYLIAGPPTGQEVTPPTGRDQSYVAYHLGMLSLRVVLPSQKVLLQDTENSNGAVGDTWPSSVWTVYRSSIGQGFMANGGQFAFRHHGSMPSLYVDLHGDMHLPVSGLNDPARYNPDL